MAFGADGLERRTAHARVGGGELEEAAHALHA